jgi:hypothetical protein
LLYFLTVYSNAYLAASNYNGKLQRQILYLILIFDKDTHVMLFVGLRVAEADMFAVLVIGIYTEKLRDQDGGLTKIALILVE